MLSFRRRRSCLSSSLTDMFYIHVPFCVRKCLYCDFYSVCNLEKAEKYTAALIEEMRQYEGMKAQTVYIGGGTPTVLGDNLIKIVKAAGEIFDIENGAEFTVEANPGTVSLPLLKELKNSGVNRISLGAQSFNNDELKALGRIHNSEEIFQAAEMVKGAGIQNLNIDLMLATPLQTMESLAKSLDAIEKISPQHVSAYSLIIEENTPFYNNTPILPDEDTEREMYYYASERLEKMGLLRYEISNFAKKGYESRHNTRYWKDYEYIGIGAGAHSYHNKARFSNASDIDLYIKGGGRRQEVYKITEKERRLELFMLGLRMTEGVLYNGEFKDRVNPLIEKGLLEITDGHLRLTKRGTDVANLVFMEFLDE